MKAVGTVAVGHIVLTEVGVLKASLTRPEPPPNPEARVTDCRRTASLPVTKVVSVMYSGGDLNAAAGMRLADDVTFTDPAAACLGRSEVMEAFRAAACSGGATARVAFLRKLGETNSNRLSSSARKRFVKLALCTESTRSLSRCGRMPVISEPVRCYSR